MFLSVCLRVWFELHVMDPPPSLPLLFSAFVVALHSRFQSCESTRHTQTPAKALLQKIYFPSSPLNSFSLLHLFRLDAGYRVLSCIMRLHLAQPDPKLVQFSWHPSSSGWGFMCSTAQSDRACSAMLDEGVEPDAAASCCADSKRAE